jgi:RNA polymerase sigma-70 factor (ECF subfamily)
MRIVRPGRSAVDDKDIFVSEPSKVLAEVMDLVGYKDGLYGYAIALTHSRAEAEDLVQETYVRAIQGAATLRPESNVKSWMFTILRNLWFNQLRHRRTSSKLIKLDAARGMSNCAVEPSPDPQAHYLGKLAHNQVRAAIQQLPAEFREIILLREYEDLSYREIALLLGCPAGTVMSRLARARSRLRVLLAAANR